MRYEKYLIEKLFVSQNGDTNIKKEDITGVGTPVITSGVEKSGILGLTEVKAKILPKNTITIDMFGNAFFRPFEYKMVTHARVFSLQFANKELNEQLGLYLTAQFHWLPFAYNYSNMCSYNKIKDLTITLPTLDELDENSLYSDEGFVPDFEYMEEYIKELEKERIKELEKERIKELEKYLIVTGLNDYELTDEDKEVLSLSKKPTSNEDGTVENDCENRKIRFGKFKASELFDIKKGKRLTKADMIIGDINFIGSSAINNGLTAKIGNDEHLHPANTITVSYNGSVGEVFLQDEPFWASDDVNVWYPKFKFNTESIQYIMAVIKKYKEKYSYSTKWTLDKMQAEILELPVTPSGEIDFDYMERYIKAIEKVVIADVVKYKDEMIALTKKVVA